MLPSPKILVVDDNREDVHAILAGLAALGTTALGLHYSPDVIELPRLPGLRILFLDLHLLGSGDDEQQLLNTLGLLTSCLAPDNGPYAIVLWSSHVSVQFERFQEEVIRRLPLLDLPLPLQIVPLDKLDFIKNGNISDPEGLKKSILGKIELCPQLAALLSWEDSVSRAAADAVHEIFQMACRRSSASSAEEVALVLGELAVAAVGRKNAEEEVFRGVNSVLVQVVADRLQHRTIGKETAELWQKAVVLREKSAQGEGDAATLNRFLHVEDGALLGRLQPWERGSVVGIPVDRLVDLCGFPEDVLLKEAGLVSATSYTSIEWVMAQVQPPCDHAQRHAGLLPYVLGLRICELSKGKVSDFKDRKNFWLSPPLKLDSKIFRLLFLLRFVVGLHRDNRFLNGTLHLRLRDQLLAELTHELYSYSGRPGVIRFP
jgi:hypothetical protein